MRSGLAHRLLRLLYGSLRLLIGQLCLLRHLVYGLLCLLLRLVHGLLGLVRGLLCLLGGLLGKLLSLAHGLLHSLLDALLHLVCHAGDRAQGLRQSTCGTDGWDCAWQSRTPARRTVRDPAGGHSSRDPAQTARSGRWRTDLPDDASRRA